MPSFFACEPSGWLEALQNLDAQDPEKRVVDLYPAGLEEASTELTGSL